MAYCGEKCIATTVGHDKMAVSLKCRAWTCERCAKERKNQLIALAVSGRPNKLLTLTSRRRNDIDEEQAARDLVRAWRIIRRNNLRANPNNFINFIAIFERTILQWPHLHCLLRCSFLDQRWLSAEMLRLTNSPIVDIRAVTTKRGAAQYVSKYVGKAPGQFGTLKRYWHSAGWQVDNFPEERAPQTWDVQPFSLMKWCDAWRSFGWNVEMQGVDRAVARKPQ